VGRAVVDDDDLVAGIAKRQQRVHALHDSRLLVERREDHRDPGRERGVERLLDGAERAAAKVASERAPRDRGERHLEAGEDREVGDRDPPDDGQARLKPAHEIAARSVASSRWTAPLSRPASAAAAGSILVIACAAARATWKSSLSACSASAGSERRSRN